MQALSATPDTDRRPSVTPKTEQARDARARAIAYALEQFMAKKVGGPTTSRPDDAGETKEINDEPGTTNSIPEAT